MGGHLVTVDSSAPIFSAVSATAAPARQLSPEEQEEFQAFARRTAASDSDLVRTD
jgi:hypothetical protein